MLSRSLFATVCALVLARASSFAAQQLPFIKHGATITELNLFGGLKGAFANDEGLGKPQNAGLKNGPTMNDQVTVNGKPVKGAVVGQKLTVVAAKARVKIAVNCQKGDCGTCVVQFNGKKVKGT
jgi:ferredoxin